MATASGSRTFKYFAYGSNLLSRRMRINNSSAVRAGVGRLADFRLDFGAYSKRWGGAVATIVPHEGQAVWGALWELEDWTGLDLQEGEQYRRLEVEVQAGGGLELGYAYVLRRPPPYCPALPPSRRPSRVYLQTILEGAEESGLPQEYICLLRDIPHNGYDGPVDLTNHK